MVSTGLEELDRILNVGYPDRSAILVVGPPGIGKEALGYRFIHNGLVQGDYCLYVTRLAVVDVLDDMKAFGISGEPYPDWIASRGASISCDLNNLTRLSLNVKQLVWKNSGRRIRVVTDVFSPLLMLNPPEVMYRFWSQLLAELKQHDLTILVMAEEGMHPPDVVAAFLQLFDGVIEVRLYEEGMTITPLLRIRKMRGLPPLHWYYRFSFIGGRMEISAYTK